MRATILRQRGTVIAGALARVIRTHDGPKIPYIPVFLHTMLGPDYYVVIVVVLTLTHRYNAVRGHRTGSNNSGAENYLRRKTNKNRG